MPTFYQMTPDAFNSGFQGLKNDSQDDALGDMATHSPGLQPRAPPRAWYSDQGRYLRHASSTDGRRTTGPD